MSDFNQSLSTAMASIVSAFDELVVFEPAEGQSIDMRAVVTIGSDLGSNGGTQVHAAVTFLESDLSAVVAIPEVPYNWDIRGLLVIRGVRRTIVGGPNVHGDGTVTLMCGA